MMPGRLARLQPGSPAAERGVGLRGALSSGSRFRHAGPIAAGVRLDGIGAALVSRLMDARLVVRRAGIPVLMYHSVSDDHEPGVPPYYRLATSPARFREQMDWLRQSGRVVVDLAEAWRQLEARASGWDRLAVVTFDDGFRDFLTAAWPVLADHGFTATVFLPTGCIGTTRRSFKGRECLTWSEVRELHGCGIRFGSHTVTHPRLHGMAWSEIRRELADSKAEMEDQLQAPVRTFAYPYAFPQEDRAFVERFREELAGQGYAIAATTALGRPAPGSDPLAVRRLPVNDCDSRELFLAKLSGAYDWVGGLQRAARQAKRLARGGGMS